jgi:tetratricopeptide (TPR) repeat protein
MKKVTMRLLNGRSSIFLVLAISFQQLTLGQDVDQAVERYNKAEYSEAESELRKAVEGKPEDARANRYLGLALLEQGKNSDAERYLKKANEIESTGETKAALARFYAEQKDLGQAEAMLDGASGSDAAYARGLVAFNKQKYEDASREMESFLETHPKHAYAHYYAGMAYNGLRRQDKMLTHLELFLRLKPDAREARAVRAILKTGQ